MMENRSTGDQLYLKHDTVPMMELRSADDQLYSEHVTVPMIENHSIGDQLYLKQETVPMIENHSIGDQHYLKHDTNSIDENHTMGYQLNKENATVSMMLTKRTTNTVVFSKFQIWKNLLMMCSSYFLIFTAFNSSKNIQSTLNKESGIGSTSLAVVFAGMVISAMILPSLVIKLFGVRRCMTMSLLGFVVYISTNIYPVWAVVVPGAVLGGVSAGVIWAAPSTYLSYLANIYSNITGSNTSDILSNFMAIFYLFINTSKCLFIN